MVSFKKLLSDEGKIEDPSSTGTFRKLYTKSIHMTYPIFYTPARNWFYFYVFLEGLPRNIFVAYYLPKRLESLLHVKLCIVSLWPRKSLNKLEDAKSQILTRRSSPAEAKYLPSGEKAKDKILPRCPLNTRTYNEETNKIFILLFSHT